MRLTASDSLGGGTNTRALICLNLINILRIKFSWLMFLREKQN
jgi:hypothetical protein